MAEHTEIGDIAAVTGKYTKGDQEKNRYRTIGTLMQTEHSDGKKHFWIKLDADILHASLFALVRAASMKAGDDSFICSVFEPRPEPGNGGGKAQAAPPPGVNDDEIPF